MAVMIGVSLVASACGSGSDGSTSQAAASSVTSESDASEPGQQPDTSDGGSADGDGGVADGWELKRLGTGIKPALALNGEDRPEIAFMTEAQDGGVFFASEANDWAVETVVEGYFYGPLDLAIDGEGVANIVYHDHQGTTFRPDAGDLTLARRIGGAWVFSASGDPGHDGWDSAIRFGPGGDLWAAGIEPADFGTTNGVEFYEFDGSDWNVTQVGGPAITYQFNVSIATGSDGQPVLSYYDDGADQLRIATRVSQGWVNEVVPGESGGMFSSLLIDEAGGRHVAYYTATDATSGEVRYAVDDGSGWSVDTVQSLGSVELGMTGARRLASLQLLDDGTPAVAFTDRSGLWVSTLGRDGWSSQLVFEAGARPPGQQVQFVVGDDAWHLVTYEVTGASPLTGEIVYLERPTGT
jgi:hypothetical protein